MWAMAFALYAGCKWLTEDQMAVYSEEYSRTGFQGGLQAYRILTEEVGFSPDDMLERSLQRLSRYDLNSTLST